MCGRFDYHGEALDVEAAFGITLESKSAAPPCYNIAPTMPASVLLPTRTGVELKALNFGWKRQRGGLWINVRAETSMEQPSAGLTPCAVLANGFYEWQGEGKSKQPFYVHVPSMPVFGLAAWRRGNNFLVLTCEPNDLLAEVHPRMPVILDKQNVMPWLRGQLRDTRPYPEAHMRAYPVAKAMNDARFDGADCIKPLD